MSVSQTIIMKTCEGCGDDFPVDTSIQAWWSKKWCGNKCYRKHYKEIKDAKRFEASARQDFIIFPDPNGSGLRYTIITCEFCGKDREVPWGNRERRFCPKPASCMYDIRRKSKPVVSPEQRLANEMLRRQRSADSRRGVKRTDAQRESISEGTKLAWASGAYEGANFDRGPEYREKLRQATLLAYKEGRLDPTGYYKNKWSIYDGIMGDMKMRSQSETAFAYHLDFMGLEWEYESKRFDLGWATYTPDFYIPKLNLWVEVKGFWKEESLRKVQEFSYQESVSVFMAKLILQSEQLPVTHADLYAGTCDFMNVTIPPPKLTNTILLEEVI